MRKIIIWSVLLAGAAVRIHTIAAQETQKREKKLYNYSIGVQPLYLVNSGIRIDLEKRLKNPRHIEQISFIGYLLPKKKEPYTYWEALLVDDSYQVKKLMGAGLALDHKWFPFPKADFIYLSGNLTYHYFDVRYDGYRYISYEEDDMTFYEPRFQEIKQVFNKIGANACFGLQSAPHRPFFVDGYIGVGYSHSFYDEDKYHINSHMFTVGYRGATFVTGLRVGYRFGKRD